MKTIINIVCIVGYLGVSIGIWHVGGFKSLLLAWVAACFASVATSLNADDDELESEPEHDSCIGCKHNLGGGCCSLNVEDECCAGGGFELYEEE